MRLDVDALSRAIDFTGKAPDAVPLICNNWIFFAFIPSQHVYKTSLDTGHTAGTFFYIDFNIGTHAASSTLLLCDHPSAEFFVDLR